MTRSADLVPGPSAGTYDLWRRLLNVGSIAIPGLVGLVLFAAGVRGVTLAVTVLVLAVAVFVASLVVGARGTQAMRREMEAGYSTLLDAADFELRDARTLELLRPSSVAPTGAPRRSLIAAMFQLKPGTVVARRLAEDQAAERERTDRD